MEKPNNEYSQHESPHHESSPHGASHHPSHNVLSIQPIVYLAEYLSKIGSISINIELVDDSNATRMEFPNTRTVLVYCQDKGQHEFKAYINLPQDINSSLVGSRKPINVDTHTLSFKIPTTSFRSEKKSLFASKIPCSARDLLNLGKATVECINCQAPMCRIVQTHDRDESYKGSKRSDSSHGMDGFSATDNSIHFKPISQFKQLPSENWAEMMDFWHCHRPDDSTLSSTKSLAVTGFSPYPGTTLVGLSYILVHPDNLDNVTMDDILTCKQCHSELGEMNNGSPRIWKWAISIKLLETELLKPPAPELSKPLSASPLTYPAFVFVSATIQELIDAHGIYTFHLKSKSSDVSALIWVFNLSVDYTTHSSSKSNAFKVFYCTEKSSIAGLINTRGEVEELDFPEVAVQSVIDHLVQVTATLPSNARNFGKWSVGLLDK